MRIGIVSGFFNPLHGGHLDMIEATARLSDQLIVIVNNDVQQVIKKGTVILNEHNRARLIGALRDVDEVIIAIDDDSTVIRTLQRVAEKYSNDKLIFANGGDRDSEKSIPEAEVCHAYNIQLLFEVGGNEKVESSTRINKALGYKK